MALAAALEEMPDAPGARTSLFELLRGLQLAAREQGLRRLDFAIGGVLVRLERDGFDRASLVAVRELARRFESLGTLGETGTRQVVPARSPSPREPEPAFEGRASGFGQAPSHAAAGQVVQAAAGQVVAPRSNLRGRRVLVADDDPEVRWFYVHVLKRAGLVVYEASDGLGAMDMARVDPPDVILADILMPGLDGLGLCEAVRREPRLDGVPVVLLSWRQDFVHRMRELRAEAQGYLRKEASAQQVLQQVAEVLAPQTQLEAQLREASEARGELENFGVAMLFRAVRAYRPTAQVVLQDPWSLFEAHFWKGTLVYLRRTAIDGTVSSGVAALPSLVGMASGRFVVVTGPGSEGDGPQERDLEEAFIAATERLSRTIQQLASSVDRRVSFAESALGLYVRHSPESVRALVARLAAGETPKSLWESGETSRALVDALLNTLARQAVIQGVEGTDAPLGNVGRGVLAPQETAAQAETFEEEPTEMYSARSLGEPVGRLQTHRREDLRVQSGVAMHRGRVNAAPKLTDAVDRPMVAGAKTSGGVVADLYGLPQMKSGPGVLGWAFVVLLSATAGFLAWRIVMPAPGASNIDDFGPTTAVVEPAASPRAPGEDEPKPRPDGADASVRDRLGAPALSGRLLPGVREDLDVQEGQGVLRLAGGAEVQVAVDGVDRGALPLELVLDEGRHEVRYRVGDDWSDRFYFVKAGHTRELQVHLSPGGFVDAR
jgi:CheY-like chemotaxis protein